MLSVTALILIIEDLDIIQVFFNLQPPWMVLRIHNRVIQKKSG